RVAVARRRDLPWLLVPGDAEPPALSAAGQDLLRFLETAGASFLDEIVAGAGRLRSEVEDGLWELVSAGRVTGDGFAGLRALISATQRRGRAPAPRGGPPARRGGPGGGGGRAPRGPRAPPPPAPEGRGGGPGRPPPPVHQALRRRVPRPAGARDARAAVARPAARVPPPGDARRAARRAAVRWLRGRAVRGARGAGGAARDPPRAEAGRGGVP